MTTALLPIDLHNDYFHHAELERGRDDVLDTCNRLIRAARDAGSPAVEVQTVRTSDKATWAPNMLDDHGIAIEGTRGPAAWTGCPNPTCARQDPRQRLPHDTELAGWLREREVDRPVLAGVSTESCIAATATDAYARSLRVVLVEDSTASVEWRRHDQTLERVEKQYRQKVVSADDVSLDSAGT